MNNELLNKINKIILDDKEVVLDEDTDLVVDLNYNSISIIQMIINLEELLGFEFENNILDDEIITKYGRLLKYIELKLGENYEYN